MVAQLSAALANREAQPDAAFDDALTGALTQNHPRARPLNAELVRQMNLEKSLAFYKSRFADASDFTFVFVGSFDLPTMKPLVERYLGALPSTRRKETWKDVGAKTATGVLDKTVEKGIEPKSQAALVFTGPFEWNQTQRIAIRAMTEILQTYAPVMPLLYDVENAFVQPWLMGYHPSRVAAHYQYMDIAPSKTP